MLTGSCHCGAVRFAIEAPITELTTCDCSLCTRRGAQMTAVPETALTILAGADMLSRYRWNSGVAEHCFCSRCGIYVFHRKRMMPDHFGINVGCLQGFDPAGIPVRATAGTGLSLSPENPAAG